MADDRTVPDKIKDLEKLYRDYAGSRAAPKSPLGFSQGWFGQQPSSSDPLADDFLKSVSRDVEAIGAALEEITEPSRRDAYASEAIRVMLSPRLSDPNDPRELYMQAAQSRSLALVPYLAADSKKALREGWLRAMDGRALLPSQRELLRSLGG